MTKEFSEQVIKNEFQGLKELEVKLRDERKKIDEHLRHIAVMKAVIYDHATRMRYALE